MYRFLLTPRWLALHLAMVAALVGCVALGLWQLGAYQDSQDRRHLRELAPEPIGQLVRPGAALGEARDRQAVADGRYLPDRQLLVPARLHQDVLGSYVVTPLQTDDGLIVPVLRGWVDEPDDPATLVPRGTVTVTGFLLPPETPEHATVRTGQVLEDGYVPYIAPDQLAERGDLPATTTVHGYLLLREQAPSAAAAPAPLEVGVVAPIRDVSPWQNLSYWAQWWLFGGVAVVFWISIVRSGVRSRRDEVSEPVRSRVPS